MAFPILDALLYVWLKQNNNFYVERFSDDTIQKGP